MRQPIPFNIPFISGAEEAYLLKAIHHQAFAGNNYFTKACETALRELTRSPAVLLTSSCTHALEMCALLIDIQVGDEVIMPSFNFVSAANAFVLRGAKVVFVDIDPDTMNINARLIAAAITPKTKAVLVVHYGGVACDMRAIKQLTDQHNLYLIEDAAHGIGASYEHQHLGAIGDLGVLSFHDTKNIHCGEGGALLINNMVFEERARIIRDKGTNRYDFNQGLVDKYTWVDIGSSYFMSELSAAFLCAQLNHVEKVVKLRQERWLQYQKGLGKLEQLCLAVPPENVRGNGHLFYLKCESNTERSALIAYLKQSEISSYFHYIPLHNSTAGQKYSRFVGEDQFTTQDSSRLLRLPLYYSLSVSACERVIKHIFAFYENRDLC